MADVITDTDVATVLGYATSGAIYQFQHANVTQGLVNMKACPPGSNQARFPIYDALASSNVQALGAGSEGDDIESDAITVGPTDVEVLRYGTRADLTDLAVHGNEQDLYTDAGKMLGNTMAAKFDDVIINLFDSFDNNAIDNSDSAITLANWFDAIQLLKADNAPTPYNAVLSVGQVWGTYGLSTLIGSDDFSAQSPQGDEFLGGGYVSKLAGVGIHYSPEIAEDETDDDDAAKGAMFSKQAIGVGYVDKGGGSFINMEAERDASKGLTELVCNGYFAAAQLVNNFGVELFTKVSA